MIPIVIVTHIAFLWYFFGVGARYFAIFPILGVCIFLFQEYLPSIKSMSIRDLLEEYGLFVARVCIQLGIFGLSLFLGAPFLFSGGVLVGINLVGWIGSILLNYKDGEYIFHYNFHIITILGILYHTVLDINEGYHILLLYTYLCMALYGFIVNVMKISFTIDRYYTYFLIISTQISILFFLLDTFTVGSGLGTLFGLMYVCMILSGVHYVSEYAQKANIPETVPDLRAILAGAKLRDFKKPFFSETILRINSFLEHIPDYVKLIFVTLNCILISICIVSFFISIQTISGFDHILYRLSIAFFLGNNWIFNRLKIQYNRAVFFVFFVVNFCIYLSSWTLFGDIGLVTFLGILWTMINFGGVITINDWIENGILTGEQGIYRFTSTIIASLFNIILITQALSGQLLFSLVFIYLGIVSVLMLYAYKSLQFINK